MSIAVDNNTKSGYYDSVNGKVHTGERMKINYNLTEIRNYSSQYCFIDFMRRIADRQISSSPAPNGPDSNGWYDTTPSSSWVKYTYRLKAPGSAYNVMADHDWLVRWTGNCPHTGVTTDASGATVVGTPSANRKVFRIPNDGNWTLRFEGGTATNITMIPTTYEAAFDGGQIITDEFIHDTEGVFMLRYMDSMDTNNSVAFTKTDYDRTYPYPQELVRITMRSVAEISNATGTTPWICIPTYGTDQLVTDLLTELSTYYTGSVAVEYGNEIWNSGFKNSFEWVSLGDVTHVDSGAVTSGVVNVTTHGFNTGDQLNMFNGISGTSFPYALGAPHWVLKIDNDNFGTAHVGYGDTSTNGQYTQGRWAISDVQNLNPCVVTAVGHNFNTGNKIRIEGTGISQLDGNDYIVTVSGDDFSLDGVDATAYDAYAPPSNDYAYRFRTYTRSNGIRYKSREAGVIWNNRHYSERASEIWAVADAVIGRDKCIHIIGTQGASGGGFNASQILAWQPTKENIDYLSIAPYWQVSGAMLDTMTTAEITDQLINGSRTRDFDNILSWFTNHVSVMDCYRVITYEGNDESGFTVQNNVSRYNALRAWMASDDGVAAYDYFYKALADRGCLSHTQYKLTYWNTIPNSGSSYYTWGINDVSGEESPRWVKLNEFAAAGGAPKN